MDDYYDDGVRRVQRQAVATSPIVTPAGRPMKIRREAKRKALERLMVEVGMYDRFPEEDPFEDGAVLVFKRNIRSVYYTYAAVRAQHVWYITGNAPQGLHWAELVEFMVDCEDLMVQRDAYDAFAKWAENEEDE